MRSSLGLNISQKHSLSPQLQQMIRLLQLSTLDLHLEIQNQIETNPLLEAITKEPEEEKLTTNDSIDEEGYDLQWSHLYTPSASKNNFNEDSSEQLRSAVPTLKDHLLWQLQLATMTENDRIIGTAIIDAINEDGFLTISAEELYDTLKASILSLSSGDIETVRHLIQHFDPMGCAASDLKETMLIQLDAKPLSNHLKITKRIIQENISLLAKHDYQKLCKIYSINLNKLNEIIQLIKSLNPKPGNMINSGYQEQLIPDLVTKKIGNTWMVELNPYALPHLKINAYYASLVKHAKNMLDVQFLKARLQEANWFIKSVRSRQDTLLKVARFIVSFQKNFFDYGPEAMKPLTLSQVSEKLNLHESTISRITNQKYLYTPRGLFELKYFFSSHLATSMGGECSSIAIQAVIKKIIVEENPQKPLSDNKIAQLVSEHGIKVARRTVTKYREILKIPPSNERKVIN